VPMDAHQGWDSLALDSVSSTVLIVGQDLVRVKCQTTDWEGVLVDQGFVKMRKGRRLVRFERGRVVELLDGERE